MGMRKCSQCGETGHNSRTCRSLVSMKLFGVELLTLPTNSSSSSCFSFAASYDEDCDKRHRLCRNRYFPNCLINNQAHRKKGVPWSEEEHRLFVLGLEKLGKGDWRGISRNYVTTRTSTQVASHAQKYFLRLKNTTIKRNKPILPYTVGRKESSSSVGTFPTTDTKPIMPPINLRLSPISLELSLASPQPPPLWDRRPLMFWRQNHYVI